MLLRSYKHFPKNYKAKETFFKDPIYEEFLKRMKKINPNWRSLPAMRREIEDIALDLGFSKHPLDYELGATSIKGKKRDIGYNIQLGHQAFFLADMVKFQHLYNNNEINEVIYICLDEYSVSESYSSSVVCFEKSLKFIKVFDEIFKFPIYFMVIMK